MIEVKIKKLDNSEIEIEGEISAEELSSFRAGAIKELGKNVEIAGFRKGHVPEDILVKNIGEEKILFEMAEEALSQKYPEIVRDNKIDAIGHPEITITKIAVGNPLGFKIKTAVLPEVKIGDYKKIAKKVNSEKEESTEVTEKDVDDVITEIRQMRGKKQEGSEEIELPELNDEFAKGLGNFESVEDLKNKIKENIAEDKKIKAKNKKRVEIMDKVIADSEIAVPEILIRSEQNKMLAEMRGQIEQAGLEFNKYLDHIKKTEEELKNEWKEEATKRVKFGLVLNKIATDEKIEVSHDDIHKRQDEILAQFKDLDPQRVHDYVEDMLRSEKVLQFLEELN